MKKIIALVACALVSSSAYAADQKSKIVVAKADDKAAVSAIVSKPAQRAAKTQSTVYTYSLERDGCCYTHGQ